MSAISDMLNWRRLYCRIRRQEGSPESLARGVALGLLVGFAAPLGIHGLVVIPLAFALRANKFLAYLFTFHINPYTIPLLYPFQCWLGGMILEHPLSSQVIKSDLSHLFIERSWESFKALGAELIWPFLAGGAVLGILSAVAGYFLTLGIIQWRRRSRDASLKRRLYKLAKREPDACIKPD
jgi:uncharacterized protein